MKFSKASPSGAIDSVLRTVRMHHPKADLAVIERAYTVAERAHEGQKRRSGEPYITHPIAVAQILADLGIGSKAVAAALLHDTVEDTSYTLDQLRADFGDEIAMLVDGVTKLDKVKYGDSTQAETVRKMIVAMSKDIRVLIIKLADRLHNARTWGFVPAASAARKATETLEIYAPLAHRLGIQTIKWELEDLSFAVLYPKLYAEIESLVKGRTPQREEYVQSVIDMVSEDLKAARIRGMGLDMDQQVGGMGPARGPGETASELLARKLDRRLDELQKALRRIETSGKTQRRQRETCKRIVLVGYTNAGKTSLMNALTGAELSARDMPFETLDTTSRNSTESLRTFTPRIPARKSEATELTMTITDSVRASMMCRCMNMYS